MRVAPVLVMLLLGMSAALAQEEVGDPQAGWTVASETCAGCHAVRPEEAQSPHPHAPRFEDVSNTPGMTATSLFVWMRSWHPTMPSIILSDADLQNVVAYILSLKADQPRDRADTLGNTGPP